TCRLVFASGCRRFKNPQRRTAQYTNHSNFTLILNDAHHLFGIEIHFVACEYRCAAMKCPACFNELTQMQVGSLVVDVCEGCCGGIWFDAFELQRVDEENEAAGEPLLHIQRDERVKIDPSRKRDWPRCPEIKLRRHYFSGNRR